MEDDKYIPYKELGGLQIYTVGSEWRTATVYSVKSMEDCNYIQYKSMEDCNCIQYNEHGGLQLYTV